MLTEAARSVREGVIAIAGEEFDLDAFLAQPLTARIATNGPTVRPVWFLWEDDAFWTITGTWATLPSKVSRDPAIAMVIDQCDLATGLVRQVIARGRGALVPYDVPRGYRLLARYLGGDETGWDKRFRGYLHGLRTGIRWLRIHPDSITAKDLSYDVIR